MESLLVPDYHYVLLEDDFSNLEEKYNWCEENQDKCEEIVRNSTRFMQQFKNPNLEKKLRKRLSRNILRN